MSVLNVGQHGTAQHSTAHMAHLALRLGASRGIFTFILLGLGLLGLALHFLALSWSLFEEGGGEEREGRGGGSDTAQHM